VEHRQGPATRALAPVKKTIYSLKDLREILLSCNRRYLEYLSSLDDFSAGIRALDRLTQPRPVKGRNLTIHVRREAARHPAEHHHPETALPQRARCRAGEAHAHQPARLAYLDDGNERGILQLP
jgi:hypothetical protein